MSDPNIIIRDGLYKKGVSDITIDDLRHLSEDSFALWALTSGAKADGNYIDFDHHRYLLPMYMNEENGLVWRKGAQLGASVFLLLRILHWAKTHQGRKVGLYLPNLSLAENISRDRLDPLIRSCPDIAAISGSDDKLGLKKIGESSIYIFHLGGVSSKDSVPLDFVAFDEVRLCKDQDIDQALERISASKYKEKMFMSTSGIPGRDIDLRYKYGKQYSWHSKCRCFSGDTAIVVKRKGSHYPETKTFEQLQDCWSNYQALCLGSHKKLVYRDITAFFDNGEAAVVSAKLRNGTSMLCTPDHSFFRVANTLKDGKATKGRVLECRLSELPLDNAYKNKLVVARKFKAHIQGSDAQKQVPYDNDTLFTIGAAVAEGSWATDTTLDISQLPGKLIWHRVQRWARSNNLHANTSSRDRVRIGLHSRPDLIDLFKSLGHLCHNKKFPDWFASASDAQLRVMLDGYLAGDGHDSSSRTVDSNGYATNVLWSCVTTSPVLADQIAYIGMRLGMPLYRYSKENEGKKTTYTLQYNPKSAFAAPNVSDDLAHVSVKSVTPAGTRRVYDITVAEHHNYVLANGVVAHNCTDWCNLAYTFPDCIVKHPKHGHIYVCPKCRTWIKEPQNGRYVSYNPTGDYPSFHVSQLASPFQTPKEIMDFYQRTTNMSEFYNSKLGLPYVDEENRGVSMEQLDACVDPLLEWGRAGKETGCAMGIDQGAAYIYVTIMDIRDNKKRIRHFELVEADNPIYMEAGKKVSPFKRAAELMKEFNVRLCVVDAMPNPNDALHFAHEFPGRVFLQWYSQNQKDVVQWADKAKVKPTIKKAGPLMKFKWHVTINRYMGLLFMLESWKNGDIVMPDPERLVQVCRSEDTGVFQPESIARRNMKMYTRMIRQFDVTNQDTGEGKYSWIHIGQDHGAHATLYCLVALERLRRQVHVTFA